MFNERELFRIIQIHKRIMLLLNASYVAYLNVIISVGYVCVEFYIFFFLRTCLWSPNVILVPKIFPLFKLFTLNFCLACCCC